MQSGPLPDKILNNIAVQGVLLLFWTTERTDFRALEDYAVTTVLFRIEWNDTTVATSKKENKIIAPTVSVKNRWKFMSY